jgi:hypothetical protein
MKKLEKFIKRNNMDSLLKIKRLLIEIINEVDNLIDESSSENELIIFKKDFHKIKFIEKLNSYRLLYEYDNFAKFELFSSNSSNDERYKYLTKLNYQLITGDLEKLILVRIDGEINFRIEEERNTIIRKLYLKE